MCLAPLVSVSLGCASPPLCPFVWDVPRSHCVRLSGIRLTPIVQLSGIRLGRRWIYFCRHCLPEALPVQNKSLRSRLSPAPGVPLPPTEPYLRLTAACLRSLCPWLRCASGLVSPSGRRTVPRGPAQGRYECAVRGDRAQGSRGEIGRVRVFPGATSGPREHALLLRTGRWYAGPVVVLGLVLGPGEVPGAFPSLNGAKTARRTPGGSRGVALCG